jgi:hypothetical protein
MHIGVFFRIITPFVSGITLFQLLRHGLHAWKALLLIAGQ